VEMGARKLFEEMIILMFIGKCVLAVISDYWAIASSMVYHLRISSTAMLSSKTD